MLLWIDRTTGLAHCYESDKSQPGRPWYGRSLAFHDWAANALGTSPASLGDEVDWLFKRATTDLAKFVAGQKQQAATKAAAQRTAYVGRGFPEPGDDPGLFAIASDVLGKVVVDAISPATWTEFTNRIRSYLGEENKRRNLVGEGFEDVLAALLQRMSATSAFTVSTRTAIGEVRGFNAAGKREKSKKVDLSLTNPVSNRRTLVTAKWSIRADREEQFASDFEAYARLENEGEPFDYTLVTNEFDAARLVAACDRRTGNQPLFTHVVHVNPTGVTAVYGSDPQRSAQVLSQRVSSGRLMSLGAWLGALPDR